MPYKSNEWVNNVLENKSKREIVTFLIDTSMSMSIVQEGTGKSRIAIVNEKIPEFLKKMANDIFIREGLAVSIMTFGRKARTITNFTGPSEALAEYKPIVANQVDTNLGKGIELAIDTIHEYIEILQAGGIEYYHPILMIITDGNITDYENIDKAAQMIQREKHLKVICYNIGKLSEFSKETLRKLVSNDSFLKTIDEMSLADVFENLSRELTVASQRQIELDIKKL